MAAVAPAPRAGVFATIWHTPRRSRVRRVVFQVHLWLGVLLGLYTAVIGISGSALVFLPELERAAAPSLFHVEAPSAGAPLLAAVLRMIEKRFPGQRAEGIDNLNDPHAPLIVYLAARGVDSRMVYADRANGGILGSRMRYAGVLGCIGNLHIYLLSGMTGYIVNGLSACAFLVLCLTGWVLWWPGRRGVRRAVRVHWRARWRRLNWDLHAVGGFWSNPLLIAVVFTGILFVFPEPILNALSWVSTGSTAAARQWLATPSASPASGPLISADAALAEARRVLDSRGGGYTVQYLSLASGAYPLYDAIAYPAGDTDFAMPAYIYVDASTGRVDAVRDARSLPRPMQWATWAYAVHFGWFGGIVTKVLWVLLGLLPAGLWATGLLLWWNRSLRPRPQGSASTGRGSFA